MSVGGASWSVCCRFFFQAEDGIRDVAVTGVQTCALPISRQTQSSPFLGLNAQPGDSGKLVVQGVVPGSAAEAAGLEPGDVLLKVGEVETRPDQDWGVKFRDRYRGQAGAPLAIGVTRGGRALSLSTQVRERTLVSFTVKPAPSPSAKQARIWRGLATGSTGS